jgi:hypothetical protein
VAPCGRLLGHAQLYSVVYLLFVEREGGVEPLLSLSLSRTQPPPPSTLHVYQMDGVQVAIASWSGRGGLTLTFPPDAGKVLFPT